MAKSHIRHQRGKVLPQRKKKRIASGTIGATEVTDAQSGAVVRKPTASARQSGRFAAKQAQSSEPAVMPIVTHAVAPQKKRSLLRVDVSYLRADVKRSLFVSILLCTTLIGIFWLVRYNGLLLSQ